MTIRTAVPLPSMISRINWEILIVVIKCSTLPTRFTMATCTISREPRLNVVGTCIIVIAGMTAKTSRWCIGKRTIVTLRTFIGNIRMCSSQYVKLVVIKGSWNPSIFAMTSCTIGRKIQLTVIRITGPIISIGMTAKTSGWGIGVSAIMTLGTIIGNIGMCSS